MRFVMVSIVAGILLTGAVATATPSGRSAAPHGSTAARTLSARASASRTAASEIPAHAERSEPVVRAADRVFIRGNGAAPNGGQWFKDPAGADWRGVPSKGDAQELDRVGNEEAVGGIYRLAEGTFGTTATEVCLAKVDGKPLVLAKRIALYDGKSLTDEQIKRFADGFVLDAWLASWDAGGAWQVGVDLSGRPVRLGAASGGLFRGHGERKGDAFADEVTELQTMRDPLRPTSFAFRKLTTRDVKQQLQKFAAWYPSHRAEVDAAIDASSLRPAAASALKSKLAARATWLIAQTKK